MIKYLLDTSICAFHLRGKINLEDIRTAKNALFYISEITLLELYFGAEKSQNPTKNYFKITEMLQDISVLNISNYHKKFAEEKVYLNRIGKPLHDDFDLLIGVTAVSESLILVSDNLRHFQNIRSIRAENWIDR